MDFVVLLTSYLLLLIYLSLLISQGLARPAAVHHRNTVPPDAVCGSVPLPDT